MAEPSTDINQQVAYRLSNNITRLLHEFYKDFERRVFAGLQAQGYPDIRASHSAVFVNIGVGAVRVSELAERAQVTQQAMGKMLKELERMGYVSREIDGSDRRAKAIKLTSKGIAMTAKSLEVLDETRAYYAQKVGQQALDDLEAMLRHAVTSLELEYLPESWAQAQATGPN